jgi:hypothetical protein
MRPELAKRSRKAPTLPRDEQESGESKNAKLMGVCLQFPVIKYYWTVLKTW